MAALTRLLSLLLVDANGYSTTDDGAVGRVGSNPKFQEKTPQATRNGTERSRNCGCRPQKYQRRSRLDIGRKATVPRHIVWAWQHQSHPACTHKGPHMCSIAPGRTQAASHELWHRIASTGSAAGGLQSSEIQPPCSQSSFLGRPQWQTSLEVLHAQMLRLL